MLRPETVLVYTYYSEEKLRYTFIMNSSTATALKSDGHLFRTTNFCGVCHPPDAINPPRRATALAFSQSRMRDRSSRFAGSFSPWSAFCKDFTDTDLALLPLVLFLLVPPPSTAGLCCGSDRTLGSNTRTSSKSTCHVRERAVGACSQQLRD